VRRWAKPATVLEVDHSRGEIVTFPDGRRYADVDITLPEEDVERLRQGRLCIFCLEPQEIAFPERCGVCTFPMRQQQMEVFTARYQPGSKLVGSRLDLNEEADRLAELDAYEQKHGIILPDHVKFPQGYRPSG
jgi:hypothetical protein